jgi:hypothetical protein
MDSDYYRIERAVGIVWSVVLAWSVDSKSMMTLSPSNRSQANRPNRAVLGIK